MAWFDDLCASGLVDLSDGHAPKRLTRVAAFLLRLDGLILAGGSLTLEDLVETFGIGGLRRSLTAVRYLATRGIVDWDQDRVDDLGEERKIGQLLGRTAARSWHTDLRAYARWIEDGDRRPRTRRLYLAVATRLLQFSEVHRVRDLSQADVDRFLRRKPGSRANLSSFLGWVSSHDGLALRIEPRRQRDEGRAEKKLLADVRCLLQALASTDVPCRRRAYVALAVSKVFMLPLSDVVRLRRTDVEFADDAVVLWPYGADLRVEGTLGMALGAIVEASTSYIFPGRGGHRPWSPCSVRHHWSELTRTH